MVEVASLKIFFSLNKQLLGPYCVPTSLQVLEIHEWEHKLTLWCRIYFYIISPDGSVPQFCLTFAKL